MPSDERQAHCDLCGAPGAPYARGRDYRILSCARCRLIWTDPLTYRWIDHSRSDEYWAEEVYLSNAEPQKRRFRQQLRTFLRRAGTGDPASLRILEVGCGLGFFLDVCEERGIRAEGCDLSPRSVQYANRRRPRVRVGTLDRSYADESFDAVFAFNLIEHLTHPRAFLEEARRVLKPGGVLALETPIRESLFHRMARAGDRLSNGRLALYGVNPGGHVYKFSKRTFEYICSAMAFTCLYRRNIDSPFGEIWGKSAMAAIDHRGLYRLVLPVAWTLATITGQGNRLFILLRKDGSRLAAG